MSGPGDVWQQAAQKWSEVYGQVGEEQMDLDTPCEGWKVRDLVEHTLHWQAQGGSIFGAGTSPGDDWATIQPALGAALADPANLEGVAEAMGGMPKQQVVGFVIGDLVVHSWDLARAIGADETLPMEAVQATLMGLARVPEQMLRSDGMFGPAIEVSDDASPQEKLLAFVGRSA